MATQFPTRGALRRPPIRPVDIVVGLGGLALLYALVRLGSSMNASFIPKSATTKVSTDPADLPYYAARSLLRMFIALFFSVLFTFVYGTAAARLRRAEVVLIPALDILQSVPILGFLSITVTAFIALFPGSLLGLECAAIFAIFTSQAWNLTFSFYHSLVSQPRELDEAARLFRLTKWQRFWKLDVPQSMIGLVWNGMMSFGGGWFFLVAAESISVLNKKYALPGIGSYVAAASADGDLGLVLLAIVVMVVMVLGVNFFFWRPLVAWSERFRNETTESSERPRSIVYDALRSSSLPCCAWRFFAVMRRRYGGYSRYFRRWTVRGALMERRRDSMRFSPSARKNDWRTRQRHSSARRAIHIHSRSARSGSPAAIGRCSTRLLRTSRRWVLSGAPRRRARSPTRRRLRISEIP